MFIIGMINMKLVRQIGYKEKGLNIKIGMLKAKMATKTIYSVLVTSVLMYAYVLGTPISLKPLSVNAQEATNNNTTTGNGTIDISNNLTL